MHRHPNLMIKVLQPNNHNITAHYKQYPLSGVPETAKLNYNANSQNRSHAC